MKEIRVNQINQGGIADSKYEGERNSVAKAVCLDIHSIPGIIQSNFKLIEDSSGMVNELCKNIVVSSNGHTYFFSSESGKIWRKSSSNVYSLYHTNTVASGENKILGAIEYEDYIYWATEKQLFRISVDKTSWSGFVEEWGEFASGNKVYHPMAIARDKLWIGDSNYVANVAPPLGDDEGVMEKIFTPIALDLPRNQVVKTLSPIDIQLAIGTYVDDFVNKTTIFRWDTYTYTWNMEDTIEEVGINAFIPVDNYFFVQAGKVGSIYSYDYNMLYLTKRVPGDYTGTKASRVSPNAVAFYKGIPLFGYSTDPSATQAGALPGVYSLGTVNPRIYNRVLNLEYLTSTNSNNIVIGAMAVRGDQLFVTWKNGTQAGVDRIDFANRYPSSYLESRVIYLDRNEANIYTKFSIGYVSMAQGCSVKAYIKQNYASDWTEISLTQDSIRKKFFSDIRLESSVVEFKVELISSGANSPLIDYISLMGEEGNEQRGYRV